MSGEIIVAVFPSREVLTRALDRVIKLGYIDIQRAAIVAKATSGETIVLDDDVSPDQGGIAGGTLGASMTLLGLAQLGALALPGVGAIIALGAGALIGGLVGRATGRFAAHFLDFGFDPDQIETLAGRLQEGHPALILEVKRSENVLPRLRQDLAPYSAELVEPLPALASVHAASSRM
jgi:uncharacterized membrane protein